MDWIHARSAWWGIGLMQGVLGLIIVLYCAATGKKVKSESSGVLTFVIALCILLIVLLWRGWR